jgi:hypothetical protein
MERRRWVMQATDVEYNQWRSTQQWRSILKLGVSNGLVVMRITSLRISRR